MILVADLVGANSFQRSCDAEVCVWEECFWVGFTDCANGFDSHSGWEDWGQSFDDVFVLFDDSLDPFCASRSSVLVVSPFYIPRLWAVYIRDWAL